MFMLSRTPPSDAQQGLAADDCLSLHARLAPEYASPVLVPAHVTPGWVQALVAFVLAIGGALFGAGVAGDGTRRAAVEAIARECAAGNASACEDLALRQGSTPSLVLGLAFLIVGTLCAVLAGRSRR